MAKRVLMLNTRPKWTEIVKDLKNGGVVQGLGLKSATGAVAIGANRRVVFRKRRTHRRVAKVQCGE